MVTVKRERYSIEIVAKMNLLDESAIEEHIENHIEQKLLECRNEFFKGSGMEPQVIRLNGPDFGSYRCALEKKLGKSYIPEKDVVLGDIPVKSGCDTKRGCVVLEAELD